MTTRTITWSPALKALAGSKLVEALLARFSKTTEPQHRISPSAMALLQGYHYPANIRELRNILYVAATRTTTGIIELEHLAPLLGPEEPPPFEDAPLGAPANDQMPDQGAIPGPARAHEPLRTMESHHIARILAEHSGNRRKSAEALGISERTLYLKLGRYGLG
jgi:two-component system response regulator AtoC